MLLWIERLFTAVIGAIGTTAALIILAGVAYLIVQLFTVPLHQL
jgi:hypothetical protein